MNAEHPDYKWTDQIVRCLSWFRGNHQTVDEAAKIDERLLKTVQLRFDVLTFTSGGTWPTLIIKMH